MKPLPVVIACLLSVSAPSPASAQGDARTREIEAVVESFRTAIVDKDRGRFSRLFLREDIVWQSVIGDANLQRLRESKPDTSKLRIDPKSTWVSFIDGIVASPKRLEEKFSDVRITTDGDIASVYFDYSFNADGKETNHGHESWGLVRTDEGWKIVSVVWSVNWTPKR